MKTGVGVQVSMVLTFGLLLLLSLLSTRWTSRTVPPIVVTKDPLEWPGTPRPARIVCYLPDAKGGHAKHVETGQLVQDAHPTRLEVLMKSVLTMECAPCSVKLTTNQTSVRPLPPSGEPRLKPFCVPFVPFVH